jgi:enediyne biosynthesis protein E4
LVLLAACRDTSKTPAADAAPATNPNDTTPAWLLARGDQERAMIANSPAVHDFHFADALAASGITFVNQIVDDAGKAYKAVHYDHGTGVCAADVDGDNRIDVFFVSQRGSNALYKNDGGGKFSDITAAAGLTTDDQIGVGCAFGDVDNDGKPDLFVTTVRHGNHLYHNDGGGTFSDITAKAGVGYSGHSSGAAFFDYDGDGLLDLLVANVGRYTSNEKGPGGYYIGLDDAFQGHLHADRAEESILYHNAGGGRFVDATKATGLIDKSWSGDVTIIDVDGDGRPDVYLPDMQGENHLWRNVDGKRFVDETTTWFPRTPFGAMGVKAFDYNGDGKIDLYVTDMHSDMIDMVDPTDWSGKARKTESSHVMDQMLPTGREHLLFGNAMFRNSGSGAFAEVSDSLGLETYWPWGPSAGDLNADGWTDLFVTNGMNFPYPYATNELFLNESGKHFTPAAFSLGIEPRRDGVTQQPWFTAQCGPTGADRATKACQQCAQPGAEAGGCRLDANGVATMTASRGSRSSVIFDIDGDGDLDIITNEFNAAPQILLSDLSAKHAVHWLSLRLVGSTSNRSGLGARVTVSLADGRRLVQVNDGQSGYLSHSDLPLYVGLGAADAAASIEVVWPSGKRQVIGGPVKAGQRVDVMEP